MKKIFYLLTVVGLVFTACSPLEEIYDEIDSDLKAVVGEAEYTLTDDDYEELELNYGSFSSEEDAKADLPPFLAEKYPVWGKGSSVLVDYKLYVGSAFGAKDYNLTQEDYATSGSDLLGFASDADPAEFLPQILADNVSYAKEGDYRVAKYFQYTGSAYTVKPTVSIEDNFDYGAVAGDLTTITANWTTHSGSSAVGYTTTSLSMAGYPTSGTGGSITISSSNSEDVNSALTTISSGKVYASALVNLSVVGKGTYFFHIMEAPDTQPYAQFRARVGAKSDGSGKISFGIGASSSSLTYGETSFELNTTYLLVSSYDIATGTSDLHVLTTTETEEPGTPEATNTGNSGNAISAVAIRQSGDGPTGSIDGIRVANTWSAIMSNEDLPDEVVGTKEAGEMSYTYADGIWEIPSSRYYKLTEEDFESIGIPSFGSSTPPDDYLPTFLKLKFPYAQEEAELDVAYEYVSSSSGAQTRGNLYTFMEGAWVGYKSTISTTLQFGHDGKEWIPDNTIKYTLTSDDYCYMADELKDVPGYEDLVESLCNYGDYDYNWTEDQIVFSLGILADKLNPDAEEGQKYLFTYLLYDNGINELSTKIILEEGVWILFE